MSGPVGPSPVYNRQTQVLVEPHPDCRACPSYADLLEHQIVANAVLRLLVMDLRRALHKAGGFYDVRDYPTTFDALDRHPTCLACGSELVSVHEIAIGGEAGEEESDGDL